MKVALIINGLDGGGGAERMLSKLVLSLSPRFEPLVVSLTEPGDLSAEIRRRGIEVRALGVGGAASLPLAFARLVSTLRWFKPQAVNTWMYHSDLIGGLAARAAGVRSIAWNIRNSDLPKAQSKGSTRAVFRLNARLSGRVPSVILCCSEAAGRIHAQAGYDATRIRVIPNGFDLARFRPDPQARIAVRDELGIPADVPLVGLIARWHPQKNHHGFVQAAAALRRRCPTVRFLLSGLDMDAGNLELVRWIEQAGLGSSIHLAGYRQDVPRLMAALDVATLTSTFGEAFPNVLGEAMACGVPCVTTDVGDAAAIVGDTGLVVPPGDADALADALETMLRESDAARQRRGALARERVQARFELASVARRYERVFDEIAAA